MKTCEDCVFRMISLTGNKPWKCKVGKDIKRFDYPCLHGWFCKYHRTEEEINSGRNRT